MIPINIAITGHRDLLDNEMPLYTEKVTELIKEIQEKYPNTTIQILTGMAEGADILCAKIALDLGCSLVAVLPLSKEDFVKTFYKDRMKKVQKNFMKYYLKQVK